LTVVETGHFERRIREFATGCRDTDLLGVNAYGSMPFLVDQD
jgi:hypothetical protein